MKKNVRQKTRVIAIHFHKERYTILGVGFATFFFGFFAGAMLNLYLDAIHSPLVAGLRSSLSFTSAIYGDGILLPIVNMIMASFLLKYRALIRQKIVAVSLLLGLLITAYFHINQAVNRLVNWTMPTPWHWNILGVWHGVYMFSVCSLIALFYLVFFTLKKQSKTAGGREVLLVTLGLVLFLFLLRLDYVTVSVAKIMLR